MKNLALYKIYLIVTLGFILFIRCSSFNQTSNMNSYNENEESDLKQQNQRYSSRIKKMILHSLNENKYEEVKSYISNYTQEGINDFYRQEGNEILSWSIIHAKSYDPLNFLLKELPSEINHLFLKNNNFSIIETFLISSSRLDKYGRFDEERKKTFITKFRLLLSFLGNCEFESILDKETITKNVKNSFQIAKLQSS